MQITLISVKDLIKYFIGVRRLKSIKVTLGE